MGAAATALLVAAAAMLLGGLTLHRQAQQEQLLTAVVADLDSEFSALSQREAWADALAAAQQRLSLAPALATTRAQCSHAEAIRMVRRPGWQAAELAALESAAEVTQTSDAADSEAALARLTLIRLLQRDDRHAEAVHHYETLPQPMPYVRAALLPQLSVAAWLEELDERAGGVA